MSDYILLTGATGLVGRYLMRDLLSRGHRIAVLVRNGKKETPEERVEGILQFFERQTGSLLPRPVILEGDVNESHLGLAPPERRWVKAHCGRALHNAATLTFYGDDRQGEPWRTNVAGTQNTLDACRQFEILNLHYVSTAYVCGSREGIIREGELDCGQGFRNDYEQSKFVAEQMVREADFLKQLTVYRPVVITGDSVSGYTSTYHGLQMYLKLMSLLVWNEKPQPDGRRYTPLRSNLTGDERRNVVPVDWVSAVMCRLIETPKAHGQTYHLAPRKPLTPRKIIEAGYKYFNSYGVEFCGPEHDPRGVSNSMEEAAQKNKEIYQPYETTDPLFDMSNTLRFTADLPCPTIDERMLHLFLKYGEEDAWGKRRQPKAAVSFWVKDHLPATSIPTSNPTTGNSENRKGTSLVGLDLLGPGGGQWHLILQGDRFHGIGRGLPSKPSAVLRITTDTWQRLCQMCQDDAVRHLTEHVELLNGFTADRMARCLFEALLSESIPSDVSPSRQRQFQSER